MQRLLYMHQMLFEMARGIFTFQIPLSENDDELESLVVLINMVAEELKDYVGYERRDADVNSPARTYIITDPNWKIIDCSLSTGDLMDMAHQSILDRPLSELVSSDSFISLQQIQSMETQEQDTQVNLYFVAATGLHHEVPCQVVHLKSGNCLLSCKFPEKRNSFAPMEPSSEKVRRHSMLRRSDARLIKKVYDYILAHLDEPLPSLKQLAHMFGTNEFKLKDGFRHMLKTSIYQFYTDERLKGAKLMIEQTETPLKNVAHLCGYNSYPNFSKAYKKKFGIAPRETVRY